MTPSPKSVAVFNAETPAVKKLIKSLKNNWKLSLFFLLKLPSCLWWGVKLESLSHLKAETAIPYGWRTQNPFRSIYFAALCGAAELSTGLICSIAIAGRGRISMLITKMEVDFVKKANARTLFSCVEGDKIIATVQKAIETGEGQTVRISSVGVKEGGEEVARVHFTWSFKVKS